LKDLAASIRQITNAPLILGGSAFSLFPSELLDYTKADYGIAGEGEKAVCMLIDTLQRAPGAPNPDSIPGLFYRLNGRITGNPAPEQGLSFSFPERPADLVAGYKENSSMLNIQTQRGCAFSCCYCTYPVIEGRTYRRRTPEDIGEEIERLRMAGVGYFFIVDSVFNTSEDHVAGICEELIRRNTGMNWGCFLRPEGISAELMHLMAESGLLHIEFGSDSLCDPVLDAYGKRFTFDDILRTSELARRERIHYAHFLIFGGPAETEDTMRESYSNGHRLKRTIFFPFAGMRLYPGTPLYKRAIREKAVDPAKSLLEPYFYITPGMTKERIGDLMNRFHAESPNWMAGDTPPEMQKTVNGLRSKGIPGPLWEYLVS